MKFIDLFAGVGGFRLAMERAGHECVWSCEIDKYCRQVYKKHFGDEPYGDIRTINASDIPDFDILCGGVPCQSWSIAGKRGGFEDDRGTMWFEVFKIVKIKKPKYLLLENVKGLLSHNEGKSFERICEDICEMGYAIDFRVLNSKYVIPQNRERVFILARRLDTLTEKEIV